MKSLKNKKKLKYALITTERNEAKVIGEFIESVLAQSLKPDEIIIADAASTDGTQEIIRSYMEKGAPIRLVNAPGNRSVGRNAAIRAAKSEIIAATDVGCRLDHNWFKNITQPFRDDPSIQAVAGLFKPDPQTYFERVSATLMLSANEEIDLKTWLPSSRSVAFTKYAWDRAGRYPEYEEYGDAKIAKMCGGEDTLYDLAIKDAGFEFADGLKAVVYWRPRPNIIEFYKQYYMYSVGDGIRLVDYGQFKKITLYYSFFILLIVLCAIVYWPLAIVPILVFCYKLAQRFMRAYKKIRGIKTFFLMAVLIIAYDMGRIIGFWRGYLARLSLPKERRLAR